jgi:carboxyl-terminal processing protease
VLQDVPEEIQARAAVTETQGESSLRGHLKAEGDEQGESSLRGHLKAEGDEQGGSQSYVPPEAKDDKALNMALDLVRGTKINPAFPPNPK